MWRCYHKNSLVKKVVYKKSLLKKINIKYDRNRVSSFFLFKVGRHRFFFFGRRRSLKVTAAKKKGDDDV